MSKAIWFYLQDGERKGPITSTELKQLASGGRLRPEDLVWKDGMPEWLPAQSFALWDAPVAAVHYPRTPATVNGAGPTLEPAVVTAMVNARMMFCLFIFFLLVLIISIVDGRKGAIPRGTDVLWGLSMLGTSIYATVYLPLRWHRLRALPSPLGVLGLIGGFGLMAILLLYIVGIVVLVVAAASNR